MIIDSHHHLWRYKAEAYGWMDASMEVLKRDYLPVELAKEMAGSNVTGTVVVQARQRIGETRWLLELAENYPFIKGVVGWLDLQSENLNKQLVQFAGHPKLVGVRHVLHDEPDDDFMLRPAFLNGIKMLREFDLVYDLLLFPKHLGRALELVKMFPDQRFVLDHLAKPFIRTGILQPWKDDVEKLGAQPNVWCKISGMVTEAEHKRWRYEEFVPYLDTVQHSFGTERIMLGSDWPVCMLAGGYKKAMEIPLRFIKGFSAYDKEKICRFNAIECYQLEE